MVKQAPDESAPVPLARAGDAAREKRLAEALRANLRRRKAASRGPSAERTQED
jgi:hypothetical protein